MYMYHETGDAIELMRDCTAILIPEGTHILLNKGSRVFITQVLGGMFTIETEEGRLFRIDGKDADALDQPVPEDRKPISDADLKNKSIDELVMQQLRTCFDPEIPINIVDLGLIYNCDVIEIASDSYQIDIQMTLTAPGCGMGEILKNDVETKLTEIPMVKMVNIALTFDPPWDQSMMTEAARLQLGLM